MKGSKWAAEFRNDSVVDVEPLTSLEQKISTDSVKFEIFHLGSMQDRKGVRDHE